MELEHEMTQASASYALNTDNKVVCSSFKVANVTDQWKMLIIIYY